MMKRKKSIILIIILALTAIVGIISYNLFREEISTQQIQGSATSTVNADDTTTNYTLTFINGSKQIQISASSSDLATDKLKEAEEEFKKTDSYSFGTYRENGYKYVFSTNSDVLNRWSVNEDYWVPYTSGYIRNSQTFYAVYDKTATSEKFKYKIDLNKDDDVTGGPDALYIVRDEGKIYTDSSCSDEYEVVNGNVETPTKEGYKFNGTSEGCINRYGIIPVDYLLYGGNQVDRSEDLIWAPIHTITLNKNQGSAGLSNLYIAEGMGIYYRRDCSDSSEIEDSVSGIIPTREGYTFGGYIVEGTNQNLLVINADGTFNSDRKTQLINSTSDVTLEAVWTKIYDYKITLDPDNGENLQYLYVVKTGDKKGIYNNYTCDEDKKVVSNTDGQIEIPTKTGYIFTGYGYEGENANYISNSGSISDTYMDLLIEGVSNDIEFKARWELIKYKIILNKNDGTDTKEYLYVKYGDGIYKDENYQDKYNFNGVGVTIDKIPTREGYTFEGFAVDTEGNSIQIDSTGTTASGTWNYLVYNDTTEDYNIYAKWTLKQYRIVLNKNDGTDTKDYLYVKYGDGIYKDKNYQDKYTRNMPYGTITIDDDKIPRRDGYVFEGFYSVNAVGNKTFEIDSNGTTTMGTAVDGYYRLVYQDTTEDYNLYADWTEKKYKVVLNKNDGTDTKEYLYVKYGDGIYKDENYQQKCELNGQGITIDQIPTREGYTFDGFAEDPEGNGNRIINSTGTTAAGIWNMLIYKDTTEDYNLYAIWNINLPEIVEVGGIPETWTNQDVTLFVVVNRNQQLADEPYSFDGGVTWQFENEKTYTENTSGIEVCVKDPNGNIGTYPIINIDKIDKDPPIFTLNPLGDGIYGYSIAAGDKDGSGVASYEVNGTPITIDENGYYKFIPEESGIYTIKVTDYAGNSQVHSIAIDVPKEVENTYTVKFDANGGTGTMPDQTFTMDVAQNLTANTFTRTGYAFVGWNTKEDGTGTSYSDSASVTNLTTTNNGIVTLFAQWNGNQVAYKVEHYKQQEDGSYKIEDTENKTGVVGETVTADKKTYEGYTYNSSKSEDSSGVVLADGSLVLKMYYNLNSTIATFTVQYYKVTTEGNYILIEDEVTETGTIGEVVTAKVKAFEGYMYNSEISKESISGEVKEDGSLVLGVYYRELKAPCLEITVKNSSTQEIKEGVKVTLYDSNGKETLTMVSDIIGKVAFESLEKGKTYMYKIEGDSKEYKFKVTEDGKIEYINNEEEPKDDPKDDPEKNPGDSDGDKGSTNQISGQTDNTKATSTIPKAGITGKVILFVVVLLAGVIGISYIKYNRLNKIC